VAPAHGLRSSQTFPRGWIDLTPRAADSFAAGKTASFGRHFFAKNRFRGLPIPASIGKFWRFNN
jgi:hypothetical protein